MTIAEKSKRFVFLLHILVCMSDLYNKISFKTSLLVTSSYSTSFSTAVKLLARETQKAIYSIYGFVRFADEIVDTFHDYNKEKLLAKFEEDYYAAIENGISMNPILNSFQITVKKYGIPDKLIQAFLSSMKTDLVKQNHLTKEETDGYIYGSAEVVGLMCLRVFVYGDDKLFKELEFHARKLGAAFQKVNFLRDIRDDTELLKRNYFHNSLEKGFNEEVKKIIIGDVENDFAESWTGIKKLPENSKLGVVTAYFYYKKLLKKIKNTPSEQLLSKRVRVPDPVKLLLVLKAFLACRLRFV